MKSMEINILSIAKYLVGKHKIKQSTKIHKLIYFIYLKYLRDKKVKLFDDEFEAWIYGPVLREIQNHIWNFGLDFSEVPNYELLENGDLNFSETIVPDIEDENIILIIDEVANLFKDKSSSELVELSHKTTPWINARKNLEPTEPSENKIKFKDMIKFVKKWNLQ